MARPEGAQALRAIQKDLDEGRSLPGINYIPCQGLARGLGSGSKPLLTVRRGWRC